jgi:hypothetical protein
MFPVTEPHWTYEQRRNFASQYSSSSSSSTFLDSGFATTTRRRPVASTNTGYESTVRIEVGEEEEEEEEEGGLTNPSCQTRSSAARSDSKAAHKAIQHRDVYPWLCRH